MIGVVPTSNMGRLNSPCKLIHDWSGYHVPRECGVYVLIHNVLKRHDWSGSRVLHESEMRLLALPLASRSLTLYDWSGSHFQCGLLIT